MIKIGENDVIWPAHEVETKIPEKFPNNPGIENKGKSRPEKSRDPGIWQNPVPKIPDLKIWIPLRPACDLSVPDDHCFFLLGHHIPTYNRLSVHNYDGDDHN